MKRSRNLYHYAVRRTRRSRDFQRAKKLLEASLSGEMQLLAEMKKVRSGCKAPAELPDNVDGAEGEQEVVEKFN